MPKPLLRFAVTTAVIFQAASQATAQKAMRNATFATAVVAPLLLHAAPALGQSLATFLSMSGSNANNCATPATACRDFGVALADLQTDSGGTIFILDTGFYGSGLITESLNIVADGVAPVIQFSASGGPKPAALSIGIAAGDVVTIRGLILGGNEKNFSGIHFWGAGALHLENCVVRDNLIGIDFTPSGAGELHVSNCTVSDNGSNTGAGILIAPTGSGSATVHFENVRVENNRVGIVLDGAASTGGIAMSVRDSTIGGSAAFGLGVFEAVTGGSPSTVQVARTTISSNVGQGIFASRSMASVRVRQSEITGNAVGVQIQNGGEIVSHGDNVLADNATNGAFTATVAPQ